MTDVLPNWAVRCSRSIVRGPLFAVSGFQVHGEKCFISHSGDSNALTLSCIMWNQRDKKKIVLKSISVTGTRARKVLYSLSMDA